MVNVQREPSNTPTGCHVVGFGAVTGVGGTAAVSMAAFRAGLTRTELVSYGAAEAASSHAVRVSTLTERDLGARAEALASAALADARAPLRGREPSRLGVWWVGAPSPVPKIARQLGLKPSDVVVVQEHGAAGLVALQGALAALEHGQVDVAIVVGASVLSDDDALARGRAEGRVLGGESSFGTVPGEAGAALVLAMEPLRARLGWPSLGRLVSVAVGHEPAVFGGAVPCVGNTLVGTVNEALGHLPPEERVACVVCNANGERQRADEWGFALPRLHSRLREPSFITPIAAYGEAGAAGGLLLVGLGCRLGQRLGERGQPCLVWTSSAGHERAAALLEGASHTERPLRTHVVASPAWARALDAAVLAEMADECGFRYQQRGFQYGQLEASGPADWRAVAQIEGNLDTLVRGLVDAGAPGIVAVEQAFEAPSSGSAYALVRVLLEAHRDAAAQEVIAGEACSASPLSEAVDAALTHAGPDTARASALASAWLAEPRLFRLGCRLAARAGVQVAGSALRAAAERVPDTASDLAAALLHGLSQLGNREAYPLIGRWQRSSDARLRREWALAELALGNDHGRENVLRWVEQDPAVVLSATLVVDAPRVRGLRELAAALSGNDPCLALGILGDPLGVEPLIERLGDPSTARLAACALELLLGRAPLSTRLEPDADRDAPPRVVPCFSHDAGAWQEIARSVLGSHPQGARLRAGRRSSVAATLELVRRPHIPLRVRRYLASELRLRWCVQPPLDVHDLLRRQRPVLAALAALPEPAAPGSWDCLSR